MNRRLAKCGTRSAYNRHLRYKETPCDKCRAVNLATHKQWTVNNPEKNKIIYTRSNRKQALKRKMALV